MCAVADPSRLWVHAVRRLISEPVGDGFRSEKGYVEVARGNVQGRDVLNSVVRLLPLSIAATPRLATRRCV